VEQSEARGTPIDFRFKPRPHRSRFAAGWDRVSERQLHRAGHACLDGVGQGYAATTKLAAIGVGHNFCDGLRLKQAINVGLLQHIHLRAA
jgi:hypothetical protein